MNRIAGSFLFVLFMSLSALSWAGFDEGMAAYESKDYAAALREWQPLADQGLAAAQIRLGLMYANGIGVQKNETEAAKWYTKAAEQGNALGQALIGEMNLNGHGVPKDEAEAAKWITKAAAQGNKYAQSDLGSMYANGIGVQKNETEAVKWYTKAAEQGFAEAQFNLGVMYANGEGVPKNEATAVEWYTKAAEQGHSDAQNNLGWMYKNGHGVPKDEAKALQLYGLSAKGGNEMAKKNLANLQENQNCMKKASTFLFDQALLCTTKELLRLAAKNAGAKPTREEDGYWFDLYDSSSLLEGTSDLAIAYINNKFVKADYTYPSSMDSHKVVEVRDMISSKYGKPATSKGNPSLGPVAYSWKLKDGIRLEVNRDWPDTTVYLSYIHPANFAAMEAEEARQKKSEEDEKHSKQSKAF